MFAAAAWIMQQAPETKRINSFTLNFMVPSEVSVPVRLAATFVAVNSLGSRTWDSGDPN